MSTPIATHCLIRDGARVQARKGSHFDADPSDKRIFRERGTVRSLADRGRPGVYGVNIGSCVTVDVGTAEEIATRWEIDPRQAVEVSACSEV